MNQVSFFSVGYDYRELSLCSHSGLDGGRHAVHFIRLEEEWDTVVDITERYTLRPTMAVDGKSISPSLL